MNFKFKYRVLCVAVAVALVFAGCSTKQTSGNDVSEKEFPSIVNSSQVNTPSSSDESSSESSQENSDSESEQDSSSSQVSSGSNSSSKPNGGGSINIGDPEDSGNNSNNEGTIIDSSIFKVKDMYGSYGINILGDSISHGANVPDIAQDSYAGLLKRSVNQKWKGNNYGFVSMLHKIDNNSGSFKEMHDISTSAFGSPVQTGDYLGAYAYSTTNKDASIIVRPKVPYKYFAVFYEAAPGNGSFDVLVDGKVIKTISSDASSRNTSARTELLPMGTNSKPEIRIAKKDSKKVTITGMGYYNTKSGVVVNNYSRSGLQLVQIDDQVLKNMCKASIVVLSLGHNDMWVEKDINAQFTHKINLIRDEVKKNGSKLIVNDFTWGEKAFRGDFVRSELKRLSNECNATFNDLTADMKGQIQDGSHPFPSGHAIIARRLCKNLNIKFILD